MLEEAAANAGPASSSRAAKAGIIAFIFYLYPFERKLHVDMDCAGPEIIGRFPNRAFSGTEYSQHASADSMPRAKSFAQFVRNSSIIEKTPPQVGARRGASIDRIKRVGG
jgi:hypothetical protein